MVILKLV